MIQLPRTRRGTKPHKDAVERTRALVTERVSYWSGVYGIPYGTISIRKQKTRWGSCSQAGNLSFNYRLGFLPLHLADYVIVHELCHIRQHNHSPAFWALVAQAIPHPKKLRTHLHAYRF
ncbi:MAG: putative metal-dependent hydrolase [Parcubacteria group bacterium]|nr:putative metal-dependent hydrolase [Parcubacteria group bacterium]